MDNISDNWPPQSPCQALLSSPSGRKRYRELQESIQQRRQTSPSPLKRAGPRRDISAIMGSGSAGEEDDEEDEETLQLKLEAIQAKLKLKKLQSKKAKDAGSEGSGSSQPSSRAASALENKDEVAAIASKSLLRPRSVAELVQVPISPSKRRAIPLADPQRSPGRILLGIDKGKSGADVSLRRPPAAGPATIRGDTLRSSTLNARDGDPRPGKTFNERMAERREQEKENLQRRARSDALRKQRSAGFGDANEEAEEYKRQAVTDAKAPAVERSKSANSSRQPVGFSREQIMKAADDPDKVAMKSHREERSDTRAAGTIGRSSGLQRSQSQGKAGSTFLQSKSMQYERKQPPPDEAGGGKPQEEKNVDASLFEPISSTPLARRVLPHSFVERTLAGKTHIPLTTMLRTIKAPDWELPEEVAPSDSDYIVFAIIGSKSPPLDHRGNGPRTHDDTSASVQTSQDEAAAASLNDNKKYMVFTLVSPCLRWSVDLYLFGTGYTRWRMLTPGTLVALLNPGVMPPPPGKADTNRWSMKLGSSDDTILEIGTSSELGWCKAVKKNGQSCGAWIDATKLQYCEFHVEMNLERIKSTRMDAQGGGGLKRGGSGNSSGRYGAGGGGGGGRGGGKSQYEDSGTLKYDRSAQSNYYISSGTGTFNSRSAASLLDLEDSVASDRGGQQERMRKMLAQKEKERQLASDLGKSGRGAGAEYMTRHGNGDKSLRSRSTVSHGAGGEARDSKPLDAKELGLHGGKGADVQLSPLKRKKSALSEAVDAVAEGRVRKKTRFVTSTGIKVAGRESLPGQQAAQQEDSDDDLEIV